MNAALVLLVALAQAVHGARMGASATPVQQVVRLLEDMLSKGKAEKKAEEADFVRYKGFCESTAAEKRRAIEDAGDRATELRASMAKLAADAKRLTEEVGIHDEDIATWTKDIDAATKVREVEKADFSTSQQDYTESIDAVNNAMDVLRKNAADPNALMQLRKSGLVPDEAKQSMEAFMQAGADLKARDSKSSGIISMLDELLEKFTRERDKLEKDEMHAQKAYDALMTDLEAQVDEAKRDSRDKQATKSSKLEAASAAKGDLEETSAAKDADEGYLKDLVATCESKAADFVARQRLRAEEIEAVGKAIDIISSDEVSGSSGKYMRLLEVGTGTSLASLRSEQRNRLQAVAASYLEKRAQTLGSRVLAAAAARLAADPFSKVRKLIKDLLVRLLSEANEEAQHKAWCDTELSTNAQTRREKTQAAETLHAQIDGLEASLTQITEELALLNKAVKEIDEAIESASKLRHEEEMKNAETVRDAKDARAAIAQALVVLRDFYAKAQGAAALLQEQQPEAPPIFDSPYRGMQGDADGVVGMLEVISSDFQRLEVETESAEVSAQKAFETFMSDSKADKSSKERDIESKSAQKQDQTSALNVAKGDLDGTQKELNAALDYFDKLKPSCVDSAESFEDRVSRRKEEVESLQDALRILNGEDLA